MISLSKRILMMPLALLILMSATACRTTGQFQPNPNGILHATIDQSIKVPAGAVSYIDEAGIERRNDRPFVLPYKWRITGPGK